MKYLDLTLLGSVIQAKRKRHAYTQGTLARLMEISRKTYGQKEDRPGSFTLYELNALAKRLGTTPAELLEEATKEY